MHTAPYYVQIIALISCVISGFFLLFFATGFWRPRLPRIMSCISGSLIVGISIWYSVRLENEIISYLLLFFLELLIIKIVVHVTWLEAALGAIGSVFYYVCLKGVVVGTFALALRKNLYQIITVPTLSLWVLTATMLLKAIFFGIMFRKKIIPKLRALISSQWEAVMVLVQHITLFMFMLFYSYNYYYNLDLIWFSFAQLLLSVLMFALYHMILYYGARVSYLLDTDVHNDLINTQLKSQLAQYKSRQELFHQIDSFKHQFREATLSLQYLASVRDFDKVEDFLTQNLPQILNYLPVNKVYSNSSFVGAFIMDWAEQCASGELKLDAVLYVSDSLISKEKDIVRLLMEIRDLYMLLAEPIPNADIRLKGNTLRKRFIINAVGPFKGIIEEKEEYPYFITAKGKEVKSCYHRLIALVDELGGTVFWKVEGKPSNFTLTISFHSDT